MEEKKPEEEPQPQEEKPKPSEEKPPEVKEGPKEKQQQAKPEEKPQPQQEKKPTEEKPGGRVRVTNCTKCNKTLKKGKWYYRNGKYYCNKRCWKAAKTKVVSKKDIR